MKSSGSTSYRIELADLVRDRAEVDALWNRNFDGEQLERSARYLRTGEHARVLALRTGTGALVGAAGRVDRPLKLGARHCLARWELHFAVDAAHRSVAPAVMLERALADALDGSVPVMLGVTRQLNAVLARVGFRPLGRVERWIKPLHTEPALRGRIPIAAVRRPIAAVIDLILRLVSPETLARPRGFSAELVAGFDTRFDELWQRAAAHHDIASVRDRAALAWRFPTSRVLAVTDRSGALAGYAVYDHDDRVAVVEDLLWASPAALDAVLVALLRQLRREPVWAVRVSHVGAGLLPRRLRRFGFLRRTEERTVFLLGNGRDDIAPILDPERWFLTGADLDL